MEYLIFGACLGSVLWFGLVNHLWGSGWFPGNKVAAVLLAIIGGGLMFYVTGHDLENSIIGALIVGIGFFFGRLWAISWGFATFNPTLVPGGGIGWLNKLCGKHYQLWMTLRGLAWYPGFLVISLFRSLLAGTFVWEPLLIGLGVMLLGPIYHAQRWLPLKMWYAQDQLPFAECEFGGVLGALYLLSI